MRDERDGLRPNEFWRSRFPRLGSLGSLWRTLCWRGPRGTDPVDPGPGLGSSVVDERAALFPLVLALVLALAWLTWLVLDLVSAMAVIGDDGSGGIDDGGGCPCACGCCTPDAPEDWSFSPAAGIGIGLESPQSTTATALELVPGRDLPNEGLFRGDLSDLLLGTGGAPSPTGGDEGSIMEEESLPLLFLLFPPSPPKSDEKKGVVCVVGLVRCMSHTLFFSPWKNIEYLAIVIEPFGARDLGFLPLCIPARYPRQATSRFDVVGIQDVVVHMGIFEMPEIVKILF